MSTMGSRAPSSSTSRARSASARCSSAISCGVTVKAAVMVPLSALARGRLSRTCGLNSGRSPWLSQVSAARYPDSSAERPRALQPALRDVVRSVRSNEALRLRTFSPQSADITRRWLVIDADGAILGRMATEVATLLRGKHKPIWAPHVDTGDHVIVVNASKLAIDPKKATEKLYHRHTGYPGGIRTESLERRMDRNAEKVVREAVRRMLPKGPLGRQMLRKLKVYNGPTHPHRAQQPVDHPLHARARARVSA